MMHITFKRPAPRVIVSGVSTPVIAVNATQMEPKGSPLGYTLTCVSLVVWPTAEKHERTISMRVALLVDAEHIASITGEPEPKA